MFHGGQIDLEGCAMSRLTLHENMARALFHNAENGGKSKPSSLALLFSGKEGSKMCEAVSASIPQPLSLTASTTYFPGTVEPCSPQSPSRNSALSVSMRMSPPVRHGVAGIDDQIHDHLFYLAGVHSDSTQSIWRWAHGPAAGLFPRKKSS